MGKRIFMYQHLATLVIESMNCANKSARARTAVDVTSLTRLILKLSAQLGTRQRRRRHGIGKNLLLPTLGLLANLKETCEVK